MTHQDNTATVPDVSAYGPSWYAATMVPVPERGAADLRSRCRGLRHRRRPGRPDRRARGRAARLVGRGAGSQADRLERVGPQLRLRAAGLCGRDERIVEPGRARSRQGSCGRCRRGPRLCARRTIRETGMPGVEPVDGWLNVSKTDKTDEADRRPQALIGQDSAPTSKAGRPSGCARCCTDRHYFHAMHFPARLSYPSAQLCARTGGRRRSRRARASSRTRRRCRSIPLACASASPRRAAGARRRISCSPATSISAR